MRFLFNTVIAALLIMALLHAFKPLIVPPSPEAKAYAATIVPVRPDELGRLLRHADKKPTMMVIYASWCSYCHQMMPDLMDITRSTPGLHTLFLSVDKKPYNLASYMLRNGFHMAVTPYLLLQNRAGGWADFQALGSNYSGQIPYVAFFDGEGRFAYETFGLTGKKQLLEGLEAAVRQ